MASAVNWLAMVQMVQQLRCRKTKTPPKPGSVGHDGLLTLLAAGTDHFDLDAAVLCAAFAGLVVRDPLLFAPALRVDAVGLDVLRHQVGRGRIRAAHREFLVFSGASDSNGLANVGDQPP